MSVVFTFVATPTSTVVTINKNPSFDSEWYPVRLNQYSQLSVDGVQNTYDGGPNVIEGVIVLKNVIASEAIALRTFIKDTLIYQLNILTIQPPANTDIGAGAGTAIAGCTFNGGQSLTGLFKFHAPQKYDITFPYRKVV